MMCSGTAFAFLALLITPSVFAVFTNYWDVSPPINYSDVLYAGWPQLSVLKEIEIYNGVAENRTYAHHPILYSSGGQVYLMHSSAAVDEDSMGQNVWFSYSSNGGKTWTPSAPILPPALLPSQTDQANFSYWCGLHVQQRALQSNAFVPYDGLLYAVAQTTDFYCTKYSSGDHAAGWVARPLYLNGSVAGDPCWVIKNSYTSRVGYPKTVYGTEYGMQKCKQAAAIRDYLNQPTNVPPWADFLYNELLYAADDEHTMQEPTHAVYIESENVWQRFWRDTSSYDNTQAVWVEYSATGKDWFPVVQQGTGNNIYQTDMPNANTKEFLMHLPNWNGTHIFISNPRNNSELVRQPLTVAMSDGPGYQAYTKIGVLRTNASTNIVPDTRDYKNLGFQYPSAVTSGKNLIVAYSENKQNIWVSVLPLSNLPGRTTKNTGDDSP